MDRRKEMVIHNIEMANVKGYISGGTKNLVEVIRYLSQRYTNIIYSCESSRDGFIRNGLAGDKISYKPLCRYYFEDNYYAYLFNFLKGSMVSFLKARKLRYVGRNVIVTHSELWPTMVCGFFMKRRNKECPWISILHMMSPRLFRGFEGEYTDRFNFPNISTIHFWLNQRIYNVLASYADVVVITNPAYKNEASKRFSRVEVLQYGIDKSVFVSSLTETKVYDAVFVGRPHAQKGIFELLDIWQKIIKKRPEAVLALVGPGFESSNKNLVQHLEKKGLAKNIVLLGYMTGEAKDRILQQSKVFLFPSLYESFGIVALEAMSAGLPVVAYDLPIFKVFEDAMVKIPVLDNDTFGETVMKLWDDKEYYQEKSSYAKGFSSKFTWENTGKQLEDIILRFINSK